jgi:hypothetical protein
MKFVFNMDKLPPDATTMLEGVPITVADAKSIMQLFFAEMPRRQRLDLIDIFIFLAGLAIIVPPAAATSGVVQLVVVLVGMVGIFTAMIAVFWRRTRTATRRRWRELLRQHGYEVCVPCGYWLRDLSADSTACPECGEPRRPMPPRVTTAPVESAAAP